MTAVPDSHVRTSVPEAKKNSPIRIAPIDILGTIITTSLVHTKSLPKLESGIQASRMDKEPLSVQATTVNFRNFVGKSGPIFAFQDTVEAILFWKEPIKTLFWAVAWACLSAYPPLFLLVPNLAIIGILLFAHSKRYPSGTLTEFPVEKDCGLDKTAEPVEESVDYLSNMQNIQIVMGRVSDASDFIKEHVVPYLDWSRPQISLFILHLAFVSSFLTVLAFPFIPWRVVLFLGGEGLLLSNHPFAQGLLTELKLHLQEKALDRKIASTFHRIIANDALPDEVIDSPKIILLSCLEHQRCNEGTWSHTHLEPDDPAPWIQELAHHEHVPIEGLRSVAPPSAFSWIPGEGWIVEHCWKGPPGNQTDQTGWVCLNPTFLGPSVRRRRWLRRAYQSVV